MPIKRIMGHFLENVCATLDSQLMKYSAKMSPAGRLDAQRMSFLYLYQLWDMKSEDFRFEKAI